MNAEKINDIVTENMKLLSFPEDIQQRFKRYGEQILGNKEAKEIVLNAVNSYEKDINCDFGKIIDDAKTAAEKINISPYTVNLYIFLAMCDALHRRYQERNLSDTAFITTALDLKYKWKECVLVYGIDGTFVPGWYAGFYQLNRFGLGRLQFEIIPLGCRCEYNGLQLEPESEVINIHIPRTETRLSPKEVHQSYEMAKEFYQDRFTGKPMVFYCHSWLLYPWNLEILSEKSNLRAFINDFQIMGSGDDDTYREVWRLFDCNYLGNADNMPQDSSMRRAYAKRMKEGRPVGWGWGIFTADQTEYSGLRSPEGQ